ncbi:MAG: hypothetical protein ACREYE_23950, partial [Gammaproteobacteria bacterium]
CFVRRSLDSSTDATLDTGGWLALTRQGLSPCKMRRAFPSAITLKTELLTPEEIAQLAELLAAR